MLRGLFRSYLDARLGVYRKLPDVQASNTEQVHAKALQAQIWSEAVEASALPGARPDAAKLLLPALNDMIDITTTRSMAAQSHPPQLSSGSSLCWVSGVRSSPDMVPRAAGGVGCTSWDFRL